MRESHDNTPGKDIPKDEQERIAKHLPEDEDIDRKEKPRDERNASQGRMQGVDLTQERERGTKDGDKAIPAEES